MVIMFTRVPNILSRVISHVEGLHLPHSHGGKKMTMHLKPKSLPVYPTIHCCGCSSKSVSNNTDINDELVHHLERTSLVDFDNAEAIKRLSEAINFANQLFEVDTTGVEPLITVLENESLPLRDDVVEPTLRNDIIRNASVTDEDYFVAPPGNIPLEKTSKEFLNKAATNSNK